MWNSVTNAQDAFGAASVNGQFIFTEPQSGRILAIRLKEGTSPAEVLGEGWTRPRALAPHLKDAVLITDDNGTVWRANLAKVSPLHAKPVASGLGRLGQIVSLANNVAYILAAAAPISKQIPRTNHAGVLTAPTGSYLYSPEVARSRLVRINLTDGKVQTISRNLGNAAGLAVSSREEEAYYSDIVSGALIAIDLRSGLRRQLLLGLDRPGYCAWLDEKRNLLAVVETGEGAVAIVNVKSGDVRRIPGCLGKPVTPVVVGRHLVVAAGHVIASIPVANVLPEKIVVASPSGPLYLGSYARVQVDLGTSQIAFDDLRFSVAEGGEFGAVSLSKDSTFNPSRPHAMLLAGPVAGTFTLQARDSTGTVVSEAPFSITDEWTHLDGPPMAFTGANPLYASGGTWGSLFNGVWPFLFSFGSTPVSGTIRVALIFVRTAGTTMPIGTEVTYRGGLVNGQLAIDGVMRSVKAYFNEMSLNKLDFVLGGEANVSLSKSWDSYMSAYSATDQRFWPTDSFKVDSLLAAQISVDFTQIDTAVFVVASPNGGLAAGPGSPRKFVWPQAGGGTYQLGPRNGGWWWKSLRCVWMPAEWENLDGRRVFETLSHEIGHTFGLSDLYKDSRPVGEWDVMSWDGGLPALSLPHREVLGWIDPASMRICNFLVENPVDEEVVLTASELLAGGVPAGQRAGIIVEVADGLRYYFEYRSRQNAVLGSDPGPTQIADQQLPLDRRVLGLDVAAGWYRPPLVRTPIRLLLDDGDGEGVKLGVGQDYAELDLFGNSTFRIDVLSTDDDQARVRVTYQPVPAPEPPWPNGPDPSIRPWPGGDNWQSPDIWIENALGIGIPWVNHENTVFARVTNSGLMDAVGVSVGFWIKDFSISDASETLLGWEHGDITAGNNRIFTMKWTPPGPSGPAAPVFAHYCLVVRIAPHAQGTPLRSEVNLNNNEAQANYTMLWSTASSPFSRQHIPVQVANPYSDRPVQVRLHAEQKLEWFRTYLECTSVRLAPSEVRYVELMVECVGSEPPYSDLVSPALLYRTPNKVSVIAAIIDPGSDVPTPLGGATIDVHAARQGEFAEIHVTPGRMSGRVRVKSDGSPPSAGGLVVVATRANSRTGEVAFRANVDALGNFSIETPDFIKAPRPMTIDIVFLNSSEIAPVSTTVVVDADQE